MEFVRNRPLTPEQSQISGTAQKVQCLKEWEITVSEVALELFHALRASGTGGGLEGCTVYIHYESIHCTAQSDY